jgi:MYXO-CTERM domain-containing protein
MHGWLLLRRFEAIFLIRDADCRHQSTVPTSAKLRGLVTIWGALAVAGWAGSAAAQATSECYYDPPNTGRMVDSQPLMGQKKQTVEKTGALNYLLYLPNGHDKTKKWPVIVFMHGSGENDAEGDNLNQLTKHSLPRLVEDPMWDYPFIVVSPQIGPGGWDLHAQEIAAVLDRIEMEFGGDPNREYLTGLSYGGVGTYTVGMALSTRIAALMPVTPGGTLAGWDQRTKIANLPIWLNVGTLDAEYQTNSTRVTELEASGAEPFFKYTYALADEYKDVVPKETLTKKHVFGSYTDIKHDVWHATYGVYCAPKLDAQKTTQFQWLLSQSKDGTPFVDPRDPNAGMGGAGGGAAGGSAGTGGAASGGAGGAATGGAAGSVAVGGAAAGTGPAQVGGSGGGGTGATLPTTGGSSAATTAAGTGSAAPPSGTAEDSGSCAVTAPSSARATGAWLLLFAAIPLLRRRRALRA